MLSRIWHPAVLGHHSPHSPAASGPEVHAPLAVACRRPESRLAATGTAAVTRSCAVRSATGNPPGTWRSSRRTRVPRAAVKFAEARWGAGPEDFPTGSVSKNVLDVWSSGIHWNAGTLSTDIRDSGSFGEISEWGPRASTDETGHPVVGRVPQTTCKVPAPADTRGRAALSRGTRTLGQPVGLLLAVEGGAGAHLITAQVC